MLNNVKVREREREFIQEENILEFENFKVFCWFKTNLNLLFYIKQNKKRNRIIMMLKREFNL